MREGIVYIVFGDKSTEEFEVSIATLKKMHPDIHVTLMTDRPRNSLADDEMLIEVSGVRVKQYHLEKTPYDRTLYIDATTGVVGPIDKLFGLLDRFDIALVQDIVRKLKRHGKSYPAYADIPDGFPEYSGGVILFKNNERTEKFWDAWRRNFEEWQRLTKISNRDQPSLRVSLWECKDLKLHTLTPEHSIRTKKYHNIQPRMFHFHSMNEERLENALSEWYEKNPGKME